MVRLRRDPSAGRRAAGIVAVCVVGAALVVFAFRGCVLYELNVNGVLAGEFANVAHYAYPDATPDRPGEVRVSYTYSAEPP